MKKIFLTILVGVLCLTMAGCGARETKLRDKAENLLDKALDQAEKELDKEIKEGEPIECEEKTTERTYRFFGYIGDGPDMYTTLKLYSDGTYKLYLNGCSYVSKHEGTYSETSTTISLTGDKTITLNKVDSGNTLEGDFESLAGCVGQGGRFSLESYVLENTTSDHIGEGA